MNKVRGFKAVWALGAVGGLAIIGEAAGIGVLVMIVMTITAELTVGIDHEAGWWVLYSAPLWVPIAVGDALRRMESITGVSLSSSD